MLLLLRLALFALILFVIYRAIKFVLNPKRKLELAHEQKNFYFLDDPNNVRKNFLITHRGVLFEGEKYLGTTDSAFDVVSIFVWTRQTSSLRGMTKDDFELLEAVILENYPNAKIDWKSPIKEFLHKDNSQTVID